MGLCLCGRANFADSWGLALGYSWQLDSSTEQSQALWSWFVSSLRVWGLGWTPAVSTSMTYVPGPNVSCQDFFSATIAATSASNVSPLVCLQLRQGEALAYAEGTARAAPALIFAAGNWRQCEVVDAGAGVSGICEVGRPQLPGSGFEYDPFVMANEAVRLASPLPELLLAEGLAGRPFNAGGAAKALPPLGGCATVPLRFSGNKAAGGNGGAVYQSGYAAPCTALIRLHFR